MYLGDNMETKIEAKEVKVGDIFSPSFMFKITIYQRNFSWSYDDFDVLFEDIAESMDSGQKQYFLGSILLQETSLAHLYELVDGQQRLTCLAILFAVIRDSIKNEDLTNQIQEYLYQSEDPLKGIPAVMRISPWKDLSKLFQKYVYNINGTETFIEDFNKKIITYTDTQDPVYHLYEAISIFKSKVSEMDNLENYLVYLLNNVYMVYIKTNSFNSAFRLFNVLNSRGVPLSTYDLLKSENLGEINSEEQREEYASKLRNIENEIGLKEIEKIIGYIRTIKTMEKAKINVYDEYKDIFNKGIMNRGIEFIEYFQRIKNIYYNKILEPKLNTNFPESKNNYKIIIDLMDRFIPNADWIPPVLAFKDKFESDVHLLDFTLKLEKKVLVEWMAGFSPTERITSLNKIIKLIDVSETSEEVVNQLLYYRPKEVSRGRANRVLDFNDKNEINSIINTKLNDNQLYTIYGGKLARYVLLRYDMGLWDLENFPGYPGMITVEHILPQNPPKNSEWTNTFDDEQREEWTNKLGNLVLLSGRKNSQARNFDFKKKKDVYFAKKSVPFQITQKIRTQEDWTPKSLMERHESFVNDFTKLLICN